MKSNKHYYAVLGSNAVMLTNDFDHAQYCRSKYFKPPCRIHKRGSMEEAVDLITDHMWDKAPLGAMIPEEYTLGKIYPFRKLPRYY